MAARIPPEASATPGNGDAPGSRSRLLDGIPHQKHPRRGGAAPDGGSRHHSRRRRARSPDMGAVARRAVVTYLRDASMGTMDEGGAPVDRAGPSPEPAANTPPGPAVAGGARNGAGSPAAAQNAGPEAASPAASRETAESVAWRAAAAGVATLDRIEAAAAKVEADIAAALRAQEILRDGAGEAAEAAVRSAQSSWVAAGSAVAAETRAKVWLRRVERLVTLTVVLLVIAIVILVLTAGPLH